MLKNEKLLVESQTDIVKTFPWFFVILKTNKISVEPVGKIII